MRRGNGLAIVLIGLGSLFILGLLGVGVGTLLGSLFSILIPIAILLLGVMAWRNGRKLLGGIVSAIGVIMLLNQLGDLFVWIAAIAVILFGVSMLRKNTSARV